MVAEGADFGHVAGVGRDELVAVGGQDQVHLVWKRPHGDNGNAGCGGGGTEGVGRIVRWKCDGAVAAFQDKGQHGGPEALLAGDGDAKAHVQSPT